MSIGGFFYAKLLRALIYLSGEIDIAKTMEKQKKSSKEMQDIMMQAFKCGMEG